MTTENEILEKMREDYFNYSGEFVWCGSETEQRLRVMACELYNLKNQVEYMKKQCSWDTATGDYLSEIATRCGLPRKLGTFSTGKIRVYFAPETENTPLGVGYVLTQKEKKNLMYSIYGGEDYVKGNEYCDIICRSIDVGPIYNADIYEEFEFVNPPKGFIKAVCIERFVGGEKEESDDLLRQRIKKSIYDYNTSLLTPDRLGDSIMQIRSVRDCTVYMDTMHITVYVRTYYDTVDANVETIIRDKLFFAEFCGCTVDIFVANEKKYDISVEYKGDVKSNEITDACYEFFNSRKIGEYLSQRMLCEYLQNRFIALDYINVTFSDQSAVDIGEYNSIGNIKVVKKS